MKRRELIQWLVATAGLRALDGLAPADLFALGRDIHRHTTAHTAGRTLTAHAEQTLTIAAERIIPATETPGATDAGVSAFIEKMLTDWHTPAERERFVAGLQDSTRAAALARRETSSLAARLIKSPSSARSTTRLRSGSAAQVLTVYGYCTSEVGMRTLGLFPLPWRYDGCAPVDATH